MFDEYEEYDEYGYHDDLQEWEDNQVFQDEYCERYDGDNDPDLDWRDDLDADFESYEYEDYDEID